MIVWLCVIGFGLSLYAFIVQKEKKKRMCDLSKNVSCTKAFNSKEAYLFGFSNTILGMLGYPLLYMIFLLGFLEFGFVASVTAGLMSIYLGYVSYVKQRNFCLVCTAIYVVNISLASYFYWMLYF